MPDKDEPPAETRLQPVLADEVLIGRHLTRRVRIFLLTLVVLLVLTNVTSYVIGAKFAGRTNQRITTLEKDLDERRRRAAEQNARRDAELQRVRNLICTVFNRLRPRDEDVQRVRRQYKCTGALPKLTPSGTSAPTPAVGEPSGETPRAGGPPDRPRRPPAPPGPGPPPPNPPKPPPPAPIPPPPVPPDDGLLCVPIVEVCLFAEVEVAVG